MKRVRAIALVAGALAAGGGASVAVAEQNVSTTVKELSWTDSDGDFDFFDGKLGSLDDRCKRNRQLRLYRKESGRDPLIKRGRSLTFTPGAFIIEIEDPGSGSYYVKVRPKHFGNTTCRRAESGLLEVTDLEGV